MEPSVTAHGFRARYQSGCRCLLCRAANAEYSCRRRAGHIPPQQGVDAARAAAHLEQLAVLGVGYRQAAHLSGLSLTEVRAVRTRRQAVILPDTEIRILAIRAVLAPGQRVSAWPMWRMIYSLQREGFTLGQLAERLGLHTKHLQFDHDQVTVRNALRVRKVYETVNLGDEEMAS